MMEQKAEVLFSVLEYIEMNLCNEITQNECADAVHYSLSGLQKMFRYVFNIGIGEYITKRRVSVASREILEGYSITDIAYKYGYGSPEAFTRAFRRVWGINPSEFRRTCRFSEIYPKIDRIECKEDKGEIYMAKRFDISELYDRLKASMGNYVIAFDTCCLSDINSNYGSKAGDAVIAECMRRIDAATDDTMMMFRVGGDEFAVVTEYADSDSACDFAKRVLSHNGETIDADGYELEVSMRAGVSKLDNTTKNYNLLFEKINNIISDDPEKLKID